MCTLVISQLKYPALARLPRVCGGAASDTPQVLVSFHSLPPDFTRVWAGSLGTPLKSQSWFLLHIFHRVLFISRFVPDFIQVFWSSFVFLIHIFHWAHIVQVIKSNILIKSRRELLHRKHEGRVCKKFYTWPRLPVKTFALGSPKYVVQRAPSMA